MIELALSLLLQMPINQTAYDIKAGRLGRSGKSVATTAAAAQQVRRSSKDTTK